VNGHPSISPDFARASHYAITRLSRELSPLLTYHSPAHTMADVVPAAERLARYAQLDGEPLMLLRTAAYYHDIGFVEQVEDHEEASIRIAAAVLPDFGYRPEHIAAIQAMIRATKLPQTPQTPLAAMLADADLATLGRADFLTGSYALRTELCHLGTTLTDQAWLRRQLAFMQTHRYWTPAAKHLCDPGKRYNIKLVKDMLAEIHADES